MSGKQKLFNACTSVSAVLELINAKNSFFATDIPKYRFVYRPNYQWMNSIHVTLGLMLPATGLVGTCT